MGTVLAEGFINKKNKSVVRQIDGRAIELYASYTETLEAVAFYKLIQHVVSSNSSDAYVSMGSLAKTMLDMRAQIQETYTKRENGGT